LFPGRIDLGLGRAPGTDQLTAQALRRDRRSDGSDFPEQLAELQEYFKPASESQMRVKAVPGQGLNIPIWLLGSSGFSAQLSAQLGLPFSFASHFSPNNTMTALNMYRRYFKPSDVLDKPYAMLGVNVIAADTDREAERLATSMQQQFLNLIRNTPGKLKAPVDNMDELWTDFEKASLQQQLGSSIVGSPETIKVKLEQFIEETEADELMINAQIYDHKARLRSYEIVSPLFK
ncbi:MAG: LLM class flavin-dependent oxidoreductase, partial [Priestia megaterium]